MLQREGRGKGEDRRWGGEGSALEEVEVRGGGNAVGEGEPSPATTAMHKMRPTILLV